MHALFVESARPYRELVESDFSGTDLCSKHRASKGAAVRLPWHLCSLNQQVLGCCKQLKCPSRPRDPI